MLLHDKLYVIHPQLGKSIKFYGIGLAGILNLEREWTLYVLLRLKKRGRVNTHYLLSTPLIYHNIASDTPASSFFVG